MRSLLGISVWIALVTAIPGLVTIAVLYGAYVTAASDAVVSARWNAPDEWMMVSLAVTVMILTQALGILLEEGLVRLKGLGRSFPVSAPHDANDASTTLLSPYDEYSRLYYVLARLDKDKDAHGHLQRAVSQFFLTNNTLVSFLLGLVAAFVLQSSGWYVGVLLFCLIVSYLVAVIRFREMAKSIWAVTDLYPTLAPDAPPPSSDDTAPHQSSVAKE